MATRIPIAFRRGPRTKKKPIDLIKTWHIFRGDKVEIIAGPHKGTQGEVVKGPRLEQGYRGECQHGRSSRTLREGNACRCGRSYLSPSPIHYSNVNLVDPSIGKPTRIAIRFTDEGEKVRVSKKTGTIIPKPAILKERHNPRRTALAQDPKALNIMSLHENEEAQPLSAEDQPFFEAVKAEFGDQCTDDLAIRVARAYRGVKKNRKEFTIVETRKILDARAAHDTDNVLKRDLPMSKMYNEYWPTYIYGEDKEGHLVTVDRLSDINTDGLFKTFTNTEDIIPHRWQYMERIQWEKVAISKRLGRRVYKHICIVDLKGLSMKLLAPSVLSHLKPIFDVGQLYYPETLHCLYVVNAPFIFYSAWKVISAIIQPETREKIQVFVLFDECHAFVIMQKDMKAFLEVAQNHGIPLSSLPSYMGGSHPGRVMNNTFTASEPDTPFPVPAVATVTTEKTTPTEAPAGLEVCAGN
ncbi:hypothetical protein AM588_10000114 [Phytophthora nicotianae]|uniref:Large ribosomal subunit protein uL24c n=1 Tax=Phytophthora nicotianae TaxID=4792 RepID=A0A0W8C5F8_PHYNI|nr:hypothetical protein AM588_10000114 [Phytophthora nicotianae]